METGQKDIAVTGVSLRFPGAETLDQFWDCLIPGKSLVTEVPPERWDKDKLYGDPNRDPGKTNSIWAGFIDQADCFDAAFFNISPREAMYMDPQQRIIMELAWQAIEDAGYNASTLEGSGMGVFIGVCNTDYTEIIEKEVQQFDPYIPTGTSNAILSNRVSYFFDLKGPSITIDTACASALVTIHQAVRSLQNGDCQSALAGAVNLCWSPRRFITLGRGGMLSKDGKCKAFDAKADGYVRGEGGAILLLKPLARAIEDGDHIYALIKGAGINHGGRTNSLTVTNPKAQAELITAVYKNAGVSPDTVSYIETHGPGTPLGDPIEIHGLKNSFSQLYQTFGKTPVKNSCGLGSVKTNIGHLESAAGTAGILKIIASLLHNILPPNIHFEKQNPLIDLKDSPFYIVSQPAPWQNSIDENGEKRPRRAGVSSFGFGGCNAHIIIEEYLPVQVPRVAPVPVAKTSLSPNSNTFILENPILIPISAKNPASLRGYAGKLLQFLKKYSTGQESPISLKDIAYTLQTGRQAMAHRAIFSAVDIPGLITKIQEFLEGKLETITGEPGKIAASWTLGENVPWETFYTDPKPRRLSLPTYAFARERCWLPGARNTAQNENEKSHSNTTAAQENITLKYSGAYWEENARSFKIEKDLTKPGGCLVIFADRETLFHEAVQQQPGWNAVILVKPGNNYTEKQIENNFIYEIDPRNPENYRRWASGLGQRGLVPAKIIHAWSTEEFPTCPGDLAGQLEKGIYSLFYLSRAIMEQKPREKIRLLYIYTQPGSVPRPQYEAVSGFARTIRLENPQFIYKTTGIHDDHIHSIAPLLAEFEPGADEDIDVRYNKGLNGMVRQVKRFKEIIFTGPGTNNPGFPLKENGVYLISGGAGGLGTIFAQFIAGKVKANLVLTGRSPITPKIQEKINEIAALGSKAIYIQADVSKKEDVSALITAVKTQYKGLHGIIHSAGVLRDGFILKKTPAEIEAVLAPKVYGTIHLDEAAREENLDFFIMFSALAAVIGNAGQGDYAYANSFLDSYAQLREHRRANKECSGITLSIGWPYWKDGGMILTGENRELLTARIGGCGLSGSEGTRALEYIFNMVTAGTLDTPHCIVSYNSLDPIQEKIPSVSSVPSVPSVLPAFDRAVLLEKTGEYLKHIIAEISGLPGSRVNPEACFETYGIDSIMIQVFNARVEKELCPIPRTLLFEYRNINELKDYFINNHQAALIQMLNLEYAAPQPGENPLLKAGRQAEPAKTIEPPFQEEEEIAVIGLSGRYPMARDLDEYWQNLQAGKDCITEIPPERWDYHDYYDPDPNKDKIYCKWGGFLEDIDKFDPLLFNISPREAETMDPQERIFLETAWAALEDAGYSRKSLNKCHGDVGVFAGVTTYTYHLLASGETAARAIPHPWSLANRVSYIFDFHGPSIPVDTACSASLTAVHLACESLKKRECAMAAAGGVNLYLHPSKYLGMCLIRMLSPTGKCHTFSAEGDGMVPGEGVGAVILKPLSAAVKDNDHIYAVIKSSAINHGGRTNGYTVPDPNAQAGLIAGALAKARLNPRTISYIEAHGTGTVLGDPIEIAGLTKAYREYTPDQQYCAIGSVKSNIGHLESAAGIAALTKVILQLKHKKLVPSLHAGKLNPNIDFKNSPFFVQRELTPWESQGYPRRAGISSFGAGGSNAHIIIEEYKNPSPHPADENTGLNAVLLSARSGNRLKAYAAKIVEFLEETSPALAKTNHTPAYLIPLVNRDLMRLASGIINVLEKDIDPLENISEYGFDAVKRNVLARQIDDTFKIQLPPVLFGELNSLEELSQYLCKHHAGILAAYYGQNPSQPITYKTPRCLPALNNIAYTLQVGRETMDHRLAIVVSNVAELKEKLNRYCGSTENENIANLYTGNIKADKQKIDYLTEGEEGIEMVNRLLANKKITKLARLWTAGAEIDWGHLYEKVPGRVPLPVYPFERQGYWLPVESNLPTAAASRMQLLHPLVEINTSTLEEQQFTTRLTGQEFYLAEHLVGGSKTLPGAAYIEMAHAAGQMAGKKKTGKIMNLIWARPIIINGNPQEIHIRFHPREDTVDFEVGINAENQWVTHARGKLTYQTYEKNETQFIDLNQVKERCIHIIDAGECYRYFRSVGLDYGGSFQTIRRLHYNGYEALALLELPHARRDDFQRFGLHPSLIDGAFQAVMGVIDRTGNGNTLFLPFMLGEIEALYPLAEKCYAHVSTTGDTQQEQEPGPGIKKFNIRLIDESGRILVKINNFSIRAVLQDKHKQPAGKSPRTIFFHSIWKETDAAPPPSLPLSDKRILLFDNGEETRQALPGRQVVLVKPGPHFKACENGDFEINPVSIDDYLELVKTLQQQNRLPGQVIHLWSNETHSHSLPLETQLERGIYSIFYLTKAIMEKAPGHTTRLLYIYPGGADGAQPSAAAVDGFAGTLRLENPKFIYKTVEINHFPLTNIAAIAAKEFQNHTGHDIQVRYHGEKRFVKEFVEIRFPVEETKPLPLKEKGVYLVTGGTGSLGLIFAQYLAGKTNARLILVDYAGLTPATADAIKRLEAQGAEVLYMKADISDRREVEKLIREAKLRFKHIHGIIHAAGVIRDALIIKKTREQIDAVLAPKVCGAAWLDEAIKDEPLDFFVFFSSVSGVMGNTGQSDYAYANRFMDHFAENREQKRAAGKRQGKTLSIAWPLWKNGGMTVDQQTLNWMEKKSGALPLETQDGLYAFEKLLASDKNQAALFAGNREKLCSYIGLQTDLQTLPVSGIQTREKATPASKAPETSREELTGTVEAGLFTLCQELLKVKKEQLDPGEELANYGLDSIMMMTMLNRLEEMYGKVIEPYVLAEHNTLRKLAGYLISSGIAADAPASPASSEPPELPNLSDLPGLSNLPGSSVLPGLEFTSIKKSRFIPRPVSPIPSISPIPAGGAIEKKAKKIAVTGMACRFPHSGSPAAFWENLVKGRNLISEVPPDRWEISRCYSPDKEAENKTYCKWGGFLDNIYYFDAGFFGVSVEDALVMDPYQRILLELSEELLCRSGFTRSEIDGSLTGVYIGGGESGYSRITADKITEEYMKRLTVNKIPNMMAARVSDFYNLRGPSLTIDTACSSSLVAIHQACRAIQYGDCHMAIAGGIELIVDQNTHIEFSKAQVLSDDGICYVFDKRAKGFVPGEGAGLVLLKPYEQALADGDDILAVILGSAVNNDGHTMGLTVPGQEGQKEVIKSALENSGVSPRDITYLEAHGTGTLLGDPIEIRAATQVYREYTTDKQYCAVGSVKSNLGHLLRAAAVPGFIKVILAMQNKTIPPTLNCDNPHPRFKFPDSPFYPNISARYWTPRGHTRRAAISSFGFGGTNCHMILEEFIPNTPSQPKRTPLPLPQFNRKYYCLGRPVKEESVPADNFNELFIMDVLTDIEKGNLTTEEALELI